MFTLLLILGHRSAIVPYASKERGPVPACSGVIDPSAPLGVAVAPARRQPARSRSGRTPPIRLAGRLPTREPHHRRACASTADRLGHPPAGHRTTPRPLRRARRTPRKDPGSLVAGLVIAGIGLFFLAGEVEPDIGRFVTLIIGLALLAVFVVRREYGFLVPGSILTGVGIGIALDSAASGEDDSGVMMLALAGGFLGIWVLGSLYRLPQNHWWPLIPGGILTLIGLVQLSRTDVDGCARPVAHPPDRRRRLRAWHARSRGAT